jgi:ketose-bisphosphate aldolase
VALTRKVVDYAKPKNVSVEAEIGAIGTGEGGEKSGTDHFSSPDEVKRFVELTGIDSVAVSIGNEHGAPEGEKINTELLEEISKVVSIPLVLHGASGLFETDVKAAINLGISKINIDTQIRRAFIDGLSDIDPSAKDYREILKISMANIKEVVGEKIALFRSSTE